MLRGVGLTINKFILSVTTNDMVSSIIHSIQFNSAPMPDARTSKHETELRATADFALASERAQVAT
jgi:hypothetical protein